MRLKAWTAEFAEMLGNFQHNPDRASRMLQAVEEMTAYFHRGDPDGQRTAAPDGLVPR